MKLAKDELFSIIKNVHCISKLRISSCDVKGTVDRIKLAGLNTKYTDETGRI